MPGDNSPEDDSPEDDSSEDELRNIAEELFESPDEGYWFLKELLKALAVIDDDSRTHFSVQKFIRYLGKVPEREPFKLDSIYLGGACSLEVSVALNELQKAGYLSQETSDKDEITAPVYKLKPKATKKLSHFENSDKYDGDYDQFRKLYGLYASWAAHDEAVSSWLKTESNYLGVNKKLYDALRRRAAHSDDLDPLFYQFLDDGSSSLVGRLNSEIRGVAKLGDYIVKEAKSINTEKECYKRKFSIRKIKNAFGKEDISKELVLLRGYVRNRIDEEIFELAEDRLKPIKSIRCQFDGKWIASCDSPSDKVIGVIGYIKESDGEPLIKVLGLLEWNDLPKLPDDEKTARNPENIIEDLIEAQDAFCESHEQGADEVKCRSEDEAYIRQEFEEVVEKLREVFGDRMEPVIQWLRDEGWEKFKKVSQSTSYFYLWYKIGKKISEIIPVIFN